MLRGIKNVKLTIVLATLVSLPAWSQQSPVLMDANYCNDLSEIVKLSNPTSTVMQKIELCSSSPYITEHASSGKALYVNTLPKYTANSGNYYCSLISDTSKSGTGLQIKKVGLKCGLRTEMHASVAEGTQKAKELSQTSSATTTSSTNSTYSNNTSKEVLELALREAKADLDKVVKIAAYFRKQSINNCANLMQSQLNDFYDPLKNNVLDHFRYPGTEISRLYANWGCTPKAFENLESSIVPDIEDEKYAASTIKPLIEKNIAMFESYLVQKSGVVGEATSDSGISEDSNLFSNSGIEVDLDISSVTKVFFHKNSFCALLKTSETNVVKLECLSSLSDGFKSITWFDGEPKVSHMGVCALSPMPDDGKFMTTVRENYKAEGDVFKVVEPTKEYDISMTPNNLNEIAQIKCVTDVKSKNIVVKKITTNLKEEIKSIMGKVEYSGSTVTEEKLHDIFAADLFKRWKQQFPKIETISMKYARGTSELKSSLSIIKPEIFVSEKETCIGYAANINIEYMLSLSGASGISNGFSVAIPSETRRNAIGDYIYGYKKCFSNGITGDITLEKDAGFLAGLGKRYTNSIPNFALFNDQQTIQQYQKVDSIDFSFSQVGSPEMLLLKRNSSNSNTSPYYFVLASSSQSGVSVSNRYRNAPANKIGIFRPGSYYSEINKTTAKAISSSSKVNTNYPVKANYCASKELVTGACCFGLTEGTKSCDLKPLQLTNSIIAGTAAGEASQTAGSSLDFLQNVSAECLAVENKESEACTQNMNMVALGFISYMMEQYFQMQTQLMFQNFATSMQAPGADIQSLSQASNAVSLLNTQQQASSLLGLYTESIAGSPLMPAVPAVTSSMIPLSPAPASLPTNSIFGHAYAATPYGVPFASTQGPGSLNSWLPAGGTYGVAQDVASQVSTLYNGVNNIATQRTLLPITDSGRMINAYPARSISNVIFPQSYYQSSSSPVIPSAQNSKVSANSETIESSEATTSKSSLVQIITDLEKSEQLRSSAGLKIEEISGSVFKNAENYPSLYLAFNRSAAKEILSTHYSQDHIDIILNKAF